MIQYLLIFSPAILLLFGSVICLVWGCVEVSQIRKTESSLDPSSRTTGLLIAGCTGLAGAIVIFALSVDLSFYKFASALLEVLVGAGGLLVVAGEYSVSRNIRLNTKNRFAPWVIFFGCWLIFLPLPLIFHLREPFLFVYVCTVLLGISVGQMALIKFWMRRQRQKLAFLDDQTEKYPEERHHQSPS